MYLPFLFALFLPTGRIVLSWHRIDASDAPTWRIAA